jgi:hypothetical protein
VTRLRRLALVGAGSAVLSLSACAKKEDVVVQTGAGKETSVVAIDADPLALFPPNAIGALTLDAKALFASPFGARLRSITESQSPIPADAEFEPTRDLDRVHIGFYSMQAADVAGIAIGRFNPAKIAAAASKNPRTATGAPVTKSEYAGRELYTSRGMGFSVLTEKTLLFGNETGMRRALDRIEEGRVRRQLPKWMVDVLSSPKAPLAGSADFTTHPVPSAARQQLAFVDGLRTLAVLGNFEDPGLNLAGTLSYGEADAATRGADSLQKLHGRLSSYAPLMAILGIPQPVRRLEAKAEDKEVRFVAGIDGAAILILLEKAEAYLVATGALAPGEAAAPKP